MATKKGIAITNAPHGNAPSVAEWVFAGALAMTRNLYVLGRTGDKTFKTTPSLSELKVGIVGFGHIGSILADLFKSAGVKKVVYWSKNQKKTTYEYLELEELLKTTDLFVFVYQVRPGQTLYLKIS